MGTDGPGFDSRHLHTHTPWDICRSPEEVRAGPRCGSAFLVSRRGTDLGAHDVGSAHAVSLRRRPNGQSATCSAIAKT